MPSYSPHTLHASPSLWPEEAGYHAGPRLERRLEALAARGFQRRLLGHSREGRPLVAYERSAPERSEGVALLLSLLHPMEWIGLEANLALLELWSNAEASNLSRFDVCSLPIANPDGFARVEQSLACGRPRWVRGNSRRVDLNRNFSHGFQARPAWLDFWPIHRPGPAPLSEPETAAIVNWIRGRHIAIALSLHSFGRWFFYPPSSNRRVGSETARHRSVLERALGAEGRDRLGYRVSQLGRWSPFFRAHGTDIDTLAAETGALSYLVEISRGGVARWGHSRLAQPFQLFNPPWPERELARLLPVLDRLTREALRSQPEGQR